MREIPILAIIVPCYNEEDVLPCTFNLIKEELEKLILENKIHKNSFILFVNDGSEDNTKAIIENFSLNYKCVKNISLEKNSGHQNALMAGMEYTCKICDISVTMDCDGQDDPKVIRDMILEFEKGNEIVYGVRKDRKIDSFFKKTTAILYYKFLKILGRKTVENHADFRLCSKAVLQEITLFPKDNLYLRGIFPTLGYKSSVVYYKRKKRIAGKSHYSLYKMIKLAISGIKFR